VFSGSASSVLCLLSFGLLFWRFDICWVSLGGSKLLKWVMEELKIVMSVMMVVLLLSLRLSWLLICVVHESLHLLGVIVLEMGMIPEMGMEKDMLMEWIYFHLMMMYLLSVSLMVMIVVKVDLKMSVIVSGFVWMMDLKYLGENT
jgi:hypothetical protein